jgi:hypothetical protein
MQMSDFLINECVKEFAFNNVSFVLRKLGLEHEKVGLSWLDESLSRFEEGLRSLNHWRDLLLSLSGDGMFLSDADFREYVNWGRNIVFDYAFGRVWTSKLVNEFWSSFSKRDKYGLGLSSDSFLGFDFVDADVRNSVFGVDNLIRACMMGFFIHNTSEGSVVAYNIWNSLLRYLICMRVFLTNIDWNSLVDCVLNSGLYEILVRYSFECRLSGERNRLDSWFSERMLRELLDGSRLGDQKSVERFCERVRRLIFVAAVAEWGDSKIVVDWKNLRLDKVWKIEELLRSFFEIWGLSFSFPFKASQLWIVVHWDWLEVCVDGSESDSRVWFDWLSVLEAIVRGNLGGFLRDYCDKIRRSADIFQEIRKIQYG